MARYIVENGLLEAMDTWPKYGYMPDGRLIRLTKENEENYVPYVHYDDMVKVVKGIPSADVAPVVHAHWERSYTRPGVYEFIGWYCTNCNSRTSEEYAPYWWLYCPHCGAKMDEGAEK